MKIVKANGKKKVIMSKKEWEFIGKESQFEGINWESLPGTIPSHVSESLKNYVVNHVKPGGFLTSVLSNDLFGAVRFSSNETSGCLKDLVNFIYSNLPGSCYGSMQDVSNWVK